MIAIKKKIVTIVGARPQFIKTALLSRELRKQFSEVLVHTGQHFDRNMSDIFFRSLRIPSPLYHLGVRAAAQGKQTAEMLQRTERVLMRERPSVVLVFGDTNSTLAGALAAAKLNIPIAHVEAGLRSYDRTMPEEINRVVTDHLSTLLFCPTTNAISNLKKEGIQRQVYNTGDVMHDLFQRYIKLADKKSRIVKTLGVREKGYYLLTIHRASNTDDLRSLERILTALLRVERPVVFPAHPRTRKVINQESRLSSILNGANNIRLIEPVGYLDMLLLERNAKIILTDSGGVQKEAYWNRVPCITLRENTEWIETLRGDCNKLVGANPVKMLSAIQSVEKSALSRFAKNLYGAGDAAGKIVLMIGKYLN